MTLAFSECSAGIQYFFNTQLLPYDQAALVCEAAGGQLAIPDDEDSLTRMATTFFDNRLEPVDPHKHALTGLRDFDEVGGVHVTTRFETMDGVVPAFTSGSAGDYPWHENQPDNPYGNHNCMAVSGFSQLLIGVQCVQPFPSICQRSCDSTLTFGECENGLQYFFNSQLTNYDDATLVCESAGGELAVPVDSDSFTALVDLFFDSRPEGFSPHKGATVGIRDFDEVGGVHVTTRFKTINGTAPTFTSGAAGVSPWHTNQPDNPYGNHNCAKISGFVGTLEDTQCVLENYSLCQRPCA